MSHHLTLPSTFGKRSRFGKVRRYLSPAGTTESVELTEAGTYFPLGLIGESGDETWTLFQSHHIANLSFIVVPFDQSHLESRRNKRYRQAGHVCKAHRKRRGASHAGGRQLAGMIVLIRPFRLTQRQFRITSARSSPPCLTRFDHAAGGQFRLATTKPRSRGPQEGLATPVPDNASPRVSKSPFYFETGYAGWAKRPSRPFPPPFFSPPSGSFSDPLSTHDRSVDRRVHINGEMIRGITVGDDAVLASENFIGANDGVGAWAQRERGYAPLWSRLILHFFALAAEKDEYGGETKQPDPVRYLEEAYSATKEALSAPNEWLGTTTTSSALLHHITKGDSSFPVVMITQLGDSKVMVVRPSDKSIVFETAEQWHYFDCPRQLGTNSPDTPSGNATIDVISVEEEDLIIAMSDGVTDNLWEDEVCTTAIDALNRWNRLVESGEEKPSSLSEGMRHIARELVLAARRVAEDPFAASPFMERAVDEGLAVEGGKLDDISVVVATCRRREDG